MLAVATLIVAAIAGLGPVVTGVLYVFERRRQNRVAAQQALDAAREADKHRKWELAMARFQGRTMVFPSGPSGIEEFEEEWRESKSSLSGGF